MGARAIRTTLRACLKRCLGGNPSNHNMHHDHIDHGFARVRPILIILAQAPVLPKPAERPLHDPPFGQNDDAQFLRVCCWLELVYVCARTTP
jgi:hypothetical protein